MIQLLRSSEILIFFSRIGMINRLFPVKSSLPANTTMTRPPGKIRAFNSLAVDGSGTVAEAIVAEAPAIAIKTPAKMASTNIFAGGSLALLVPTVT